MRAQHRHPTRSPAQVLSAPGELHPSVQAVMGAWHPSPRPPLTGNGRLGPWLHPRVFLTFRNLFRTNSALEGRASLSPRPSPNVAVGRDDLLEVSERGKYPASPSPLLSPSRVTPAPRGPSGGPSLPPTPVVLGERAGCPPRRPCSKWPSVTARGGGPVPKGPVSPRPLSAVGRLSPSLGRGLGGRRGGQAQDEAA